MKLFVFMSVIFTSVLASADAYTVLTLQRLNYKPEKRLYYDLQVDANCAINQNKPFDVYYQDNDTGEKMDEFSSDSEKYFGPKIDKNKMTANQVVLSFKALEEIQTQTGVKAELIVSVENVNGKCVAQSDITYGDKAYTVEHIDINMKKLLGFPTGVEFVQLHGHNDQGDISDCVVGKCK